MRGILVLLANTVPARRSPERVIDTLGRVVAAAPVLKSKRGEAAEAARRILDALSEDGHAMRSRDSPTRVTGAACPPGEMFSAVRHEAG